MFRSVKALLHNEIFAAYSGLIKTIEIFHNEVKNALKVYRSSLGRSSACQNNNKPQSVDIALRSCNKTPVVILAFDGVYECCDASFAITFPDLLVLGN